MLGGLAVEKGQERHCVEFFEEFREDRDEVDQVDFLDADPRVEAGDQAGETHLRFRKHATANRKLVTL